MNSKAIQTALDGRCYTLCTFEHPAALHEVMAWELAMRDCGRLLSKEVLDNFPNAPVTIYALERADGTPEKLYAIGMPAGQTGDQLRTPMAAFTQALILQLKDAQPWDKALMFGRVPIDDRLNILVGHWMSVVKPADR